jgi:hypothetical protein
MIGLKMNFSAIVEFQSMVQALLLQVIEFSITAREAICAIKIIDAERLVTKRVGDLDYVTWMRCAMQEAEIGLAQPFIEIAELWLFDH